MPEVQYREAEADELQLLDVIRDRWHGHLSSYRIGLLFRDIPRRNRGRTAAATAQTCTGAFAFLTSLDGFIEACDAFWDEGDEFREYLLDHELSHFAVVKGKLVTIDHDVQDFEDVLARHDPAVTELQRLMDLESLRDATN